MKKLKKNDKKKNNKVLYPVILVLLLVVSFVVRYQNLEQKDTEYREMLQKARTDAQDGLVDKALDYYDKALVIRDTPEIRIERAQVLIDDERSTEAVSYIEQCRSSDADEGKYYSFLFNEYKAEEKYEEFYKLYLRAKRAGVLNDEMKALEKSVQYKYYFGDGIYEDVGEFRGEHCAVESNGMWGYVDYSGETTIDPIYLSAGAFCSSKAPIQTEKGQWFYIDAEGTRIDKTTEEDSAKYVWSGVQVLKDDDGYYLADGDGKEYQWENPDDTLPSRYDAVATDMYGMSLFNDRVFLHYDGSYHLVTSKGEIIDTEAILDAKPFQDEDGLAAVMIGDAWGFMDKDGNVVIAPQYEDAKSSCSGLAGVMMNNKWGYVTVDGDMAIEPIFDDIRDMSPKTTAFVYQANMWRILKFYKNDVLGGE